MRKASMDFLQALLAAPGPSGYEGPVRAVWKREAERFADRVSVDVHGNAIASLNSAGSPRIMLAGHMDELGFQVVHIDDEGYISFDTVGGFDMAIVPGRKVRIHTAKGDVLGVIGKKPIHMMSPEDRRKIAETHELWIDIGAGDGVETKKLISIGDPVTYDANFELMRRGLAVSRAFDNKMGAFVVAETMRKGGRRSPPAAGRALFGGYRAGGGRPARRQDQHLRRRPARRHRPGCKFRYRSSWHGQTSDRRPEGGRRTDPQSRSQHQSSGLRRVGEGGQTQEDSLSDQCRIRWYRHGCQCHAADPGRGWQRGLLALPCVTCIPRWKYSHWMIWSTPLSFSRSSSSLLMAR